MMSFLQGDFINCKKSWIPNILMGKLLSQILFMNLFDGFPIKTQMFGNLSNCHVLAKFKDIGRKPSGNPLARGHNAQILYYIATQLAFDRSVDNEKKGFSIKDVQVSDYSLMIGMYFMYALLTSMAYRIISFVWLHFYCYNLIQYICYLFHNLYSTKLEKCLNLYLGHRLSSSGFGLIAKITYPEKIAMSTTYIISLSIFREKNL